MRVTGLCLALLAFLGAPRLEAAGKPNLLFIFSDDQCYETMSLLGSDVRTPNLDRLAREGTMFTHAYNMGAWNGAVCIASRTMLVTGRFLWRALATEERRQEWTERKSYWPQLLASAGYETYMTGKWHVKASSEQLFDHVVHERPGMPNQTPQGYNRPKDREDYRRGWKPWDKQYGGFWKGGTHWSEVLGDDAVGFLRRAADRDRPFFMYLAFNAPHDPRQSPKEYVEKYPLDTVEVPENFIPEYPYKDSIGCGPDKRDARLAPFPRTEFAVKVHRREYYAIITHMDDQIGRILEALERSGKKDNTCIFFTSDHGLAVGRHGLIGKQNMYDHSVRVPLIVAGPGIPKGRRIDTRVYLQDIMPTTLELAGVDKPDDVDFKSLLPLIRGEAGEPYPAIYGAFMDLQRMITRDGFKLIVYPVIDTVRLYDLARDPLEMNDLAARPEYASKIAELKRELRKLQSEMGDTLKL